MPRFYIHATVNTPRGESDYTRLELDDLNGLMDRLIQHHASATSVVLSIVPNGDSVTFVKSEPK